MIRSVLVKVRNVNLIHLAKYAVSVILVIAQQVLSVLNQIPVKRAKCAVIARTALVYPGANVARLNHAVQTINNIIIN
jgi:hypothetical protein